MKEKTVYPYRVIIDGHPEDDSAQTFEIFSDQLLKEKDIISINDEYFQITFIMDENNDVVVERMSNVAIRVYKIMN